MCPKVLNTYFQERAGVLRVGSLLNEAGLIFRETPNADVGIDGLVELVDERGEASGATIAVQIKSGTSYLIDSGEDWKYYPHVKHQSYWEMYPLPVVLMLHDPRTDKVYWADVRLQLRSDQKAKSPLLVPKLSVLDEESIGSLFASCGSAGVGLLSIHDALRSLVMTCSDNPCFPISHLDIFLEGLTDIGRKLFFSAGLCWELAELCMTDDSPVGVGMGGCEQQFLDSYLRFLVEQSLAHIDYSDVLIDIQDREMYPTILVPLTSRGRELLNLCRELGACGSSYELTEATVGLIDGNSRISRTMGNIEVARKLTSQFSSEQKA